MLILVIRQSFQRGVYSEAATGVVLPKKESLKISQIRQVNNCVGVSFDRSSHWRSSVEKGILKTFANFTGKHLCWNVLIHSVKNFVKKRLQHRCFPVKFAKLLRTPILKNICERLLPSIDLFLKGCIFCETLLYCNRLG